MNKLMRKDISKLFFLYQVNRARRHQYYRSHDSVGEGRVYIIALAHAHLPAYTHACRPHISRAPIYRERFPEFVNISDVCNNKIRRKSDSSRYPDKLQYHRIVYIPVSCQFSVCVPDSCCRSCISDFTAIASDRDP